MKTLYQVHVAEGRPFRVLLKFRRAQRAVRLLKHFGFKDAYIAGTVVVVGPTRVSYPWAR